MHLYAAAFLMSTNSRGSESSTKRCTNNVPKIQIKEHGHGPFFPFFILFQCFFIRHATETSLSAAATPTPAFDLVPFKGVFSSVLKQMDL